MKKWNALHLPVQAVDVALFGTQPHDPAPLVGAVQAHVSAASDGFLVYPLLHA